MRKWTTLASLTLAAAASAPAFGQGVEVDSNLPNYKPVDGVSGTIKSVGSDTMNNMMALWAEDFKRLYPNVEVEIEGKGSGTAPTALIEGTSTFGPMSRPMKSSEADKFEAAFGYKPTQIGTSIDMVAVYVNKDNPISGMSLPQADAVFSSTRKLGYPEDVIKWGQLGLEGEWEASAISVYGRNSASGTYAYFKKNAMGDGDYKNTVKEQPGSSAVVQGIGSDDYGIGYSGIGYMTADVRAVALATEQGDQPIPAEAEYAYSGEYPLSRYLYLTVNYKPGTQLDPLRAEFVKYIFSKQGQEAVVEDGYLPVTAAVAREQLQQVGITPDF